MVMKRLGLSAALVIGLATGAQAFVAPNGFVVQATGSGNFQVMNRGGISSDNAWCAAGAYAMGVLGVSPGTQIYRVSPPPAPRGANIEFSLSSVGAATSTGMSTIGGSGGGGMSAAAARNICNVVTSGGRRR
jgi:hypothetical protein